MHEQRDVSGTTSLRVNAIRTGVPIGALIHTTSGSDSLAWLQRTSAEAGHPASADYLIGRTGVRYNISPPGRYAYHAGVSTLRIPITIESYSEKHDDAVSELLIGIELESLPTQNCTLEQIDSLAELVSLLALKHRWRWPYFLRGHYDVAKPIGRRSDPLGFDWGGFAGRLLYWANTNKVPGITP